MPVVPVVAVVPVVVPAEVEGELEEISRPVTVTRCPRCRSSSLDPPSSFQVAAGIMLLDSLPAVVVVAVVPVVVPVVPVVVPVVVLTADVTTGSAFLSPDLGRDPQGK